MHNVVYVPTCFGMVHEIVSSEAQVHDMTCFPTAKDPEVLSCSYMTLSARVLSPVEEYGRDFLAKMTYPVVDADVDLTLTRVDLGSRESANLDPD